MIQTNNVHLKFADYFNNKEMMPYLYMLSKKLADGSVCFNLDDIDWQKLKEEETALSDFKIISTEDLKKNELVSDGQTKKPLVLDNNRLYLQRYYNYETRVLQKIEALIDDENWKETGQSLEKIKDEVLKLFSENTSGQTDWQAVAAISAVLNKFCIITGGPGTGKTTTLAKVLSLLYKINPDMKVALAAPTGKAAQRMSESLKESAKNFPEVASKFEMLEPSTLHRLLGYIKNSIYFKHNTENPLNYDLVIVDESSMIDLALFSKLLDAIGQKSRLILVGDKNQLASVEAGSLFGDLCMSQQKLNVFSPERIEFINSFLSNQNSKISLEETDSNKHPLFEHIIELKHSYRFEGKGGIGKFSKAIIENQSEEISSFFDNKDDQILIDTDYSNEIFEKFAENFFTYIDEPDIEKALQKLNNQRVLCAVREGETGVYEMNRKIEKFLYKKSKISPGGQFYENQPVMITSNNYELGLFNGDTGIVRNQKVWFQSSDSKTIKSFPTAFIENAETVYAMTIHKSQGSEFEKVLCVLPENEQNKLMTAELLYTAVTRAKKKVIIQSSHEHILNCASKHVERSSGINYRFKG